MTAMDFALLMTGPVLLILAGFATLFIARHLR